MLFAKTITAFESFTLHLSGMRFIFDYEMVCRGEESELTRYRPVFGRGEGEDRRVPEKSVLWKTEDVLELMKKCGVAAWDGFHGKHPKNVTDGIMFRFTARVDEGREIHASGSENFPRGFREFRQAIETSLRETE